MQIGAVNLRLLKTKKFSSLLYKDFIQILSKGPQESVKHKPKTIASETIY